MKPPGGTGWRMLDALYARIRDINTALYRSDIRYSEEEHRGEFMRRAFHALSFNDISGDYAEFGSHGGTTFRLAYSEIRRWAHDRTLWAFDSFQGLPEQRSPQDYHPGWKPGKMTTSLAEFIETCRRNGIPRDRYRVVAGYYEDTLDRSTRDESQLPDDIALSYIDCDLYSSTITVLEFLRPRLKHGMIIAFDDYFAYSDRSVSGNRKAMVDFFTDYSDYGLIPYMQIGWHGMSYVVEDRRLLN